LLGPHTIANETPVASFAASSRDRRLNVLYGLYLNKDNQYADSGLEESNITAVASSLHGLHGDFMVSTLSLRTCTTYLIISSVHEKVEKQAKAKANAFTSGPWEINVSISHLVSIGY
jgi:hypothetical protein